MIVADDTLLLQVGQCTADGFGAYAEIACDVRLGHEEMNPAPVLHVVQQVAFAQALDEAQQTLLRAQLPAVERGKAREGMTTTEVTAGS